MLNFCDFIQVFLFTTNHHLKHLCRDPSLELSRKADLPMFCGDEVILVQALSIIISRKPGPRFTITP